MYIARRIYVRFRGRTGQFNDKFINECLPPRAQRHRSIVSSRDRDHPRRSADAGDPQHD